MPESPFSNSLSSNNTSPEMRDFLDFTSQRKLIFDNVKNAFASKFPLSNQNYTLELSDLGYEKASDYKLKEQKNAIIEKKSLNWPLYGTWRLKDNNDGSVLGETRKLVARVPYLTQRGTMIYNGNEYTGINQQRLRPGIYTRQKENNELEAHVSLVPGTGSSFRVFMEPETGVFRFNIGQANIPAFPVLKALGATDDEIKEAWGEDLLKVNQEKGRDFNLDKVYHKLANYKIREQYERPEDGIPKVFENMELDPDIIEHNLGIREKAVNKNVLIRTMQKLRNLHNGQEEPDNRDSQANQFFVSPEDMFAERVEKDAGQLARKLLWKITNTKDVEKIPTGYFTKQIDSFLLGSGLAAPPVEVNPLELLDQATRVTRMGQGGISDDSAIPDEARTVQPTQAGLIDPIRTVESTRVGVDTRVSINTFKGKDGQLYTKVIDAKTGKPTLVSGRELSVKNVAFPNEWDKDKKTVNAMAGEKMKPIDRSEVDYIIPSGDDMYSLGSNLIPGFSGMKGGRLIMGSRMLTQALPLEKPEAPLVQSATSEDPNTSYEEKYGQFMGTSFSPVTGTVVDIDDDTVVIADARGKKHEVELYNNFILNQKTAIHSTPTVKKGDTVKANQMVAKSNFTDDNGTTALGLNLKTVFMPYKGNFEDGVVISESAAKKLTSQHMYTSSLDTRGDEIYVDKNRFMGLYPHKFNKKQLATIDKNGIVKPGTVVHKEDPLILATGKRIPTKGSSLLKQKKSWNTDETVTWTKDKPGIVTDVSTAKGEVKVAVKSLVSAGIADKLSNRYGSKGVIVNIVPDDKMPQTKDGDPFEVILNPLSIISRVNSIQIPELLLSKIARKTGKPYKVPTFTDDSYLDFTLGELKKHGIPETETVYDPATNKNLKNMLTGEQFFLKLHHTSESKQSSRGDTGSYTMDRIPAKSEGASSKRLGGLEHTALIAHGVPEVIKDAKFIRGQQNDEFWRAFRSGYPTKMPKETFIYDKFLNMLKASGVNVNRTGDGMSLFAMTDKDIDKLTGNRVLESGDAIDLRTLEPVKGGLFDVRKTGGRDGNLYSAIKLDEPMPNPIMEDPIRRLLGLTQKGFMDRLKEDNGTKRIKEELSAINVEDEISNQIRIIKSGKKSKRDEAVKLLSYLLSLKKNDVKPEEMMISKFPVLPPQFRPVSIVKGMELSSDANYLYKDLFEANKNLSELKKEIDDVGEERQLLYESLKAVTGLGKPVNTKNKEKGVVGLLKHVFGKNSPKSGLIQRKLLSSTVDVVGRGVVTSDSRFDMDEIGIPEDLAWNTYKPFIMRRLAKRYNSGEKTKVPMTELAKWIANKDPRAKQALMEEMEERPVVYSRAPVLHKYGIIGGKPKLVNGNYIIVSPLNVAGLGMDFDGDTANFHVPVSDEAVKEVNDKMLPSKNLLAEANFEAHQKPSQEFLYGLYLATRKANSKKAPRIFADKKAALQALLDGKIELNDPIEVRNS